MNLAEALRLANPETIAFVGAGGKSTAMFQLAREISPPVIATATTHLGNWQIPLADQHIIADKPDKLSNREFRGVMLITGPLGEENRFQGVDNGVLKWLRAEAQSSGISLLIEADGSRQKPIKAPAEHEPVIPEFVDMVVVVAGLKALGKPLTDEFVHRRELFARLSGLEIGDSISLESVVKVLTSPEGGLKNIPPRARRIILLNQADTPELQAAAQSMAPLLLRKFHSVIIASLEQKTIHAVHEPVAGIILAAGESKRFGQPKQLLDWRERPFILSVIQTALEAGLSPIIVVTGAHAEQIEDVIKSQEITIVRNREWPRGQSTSIRVGIQALPAETGSAIFLLADQPQITTPILHSLIETHAREPFPIVAPLIQSERRANPVLFDRITFNDLLAIEGDVGGRAIFSKHRVEYLPWHDESLLLDVDEPEDYARLKELE